jgi:hypothetical protein
MVDQDFRKGSRKTNGYRNVEAAKEQMKNNGDVASAKQTNDKQMRGSGG